ncbi:MAG: dTMP kinase [Bacillota bacterium]
MNPRGALITFEGLDGTGKTTQARLLTRWLRDRGLKVRYTREPGGTPIGRALRALALARRRSGAGPVPEAELLLLMADRAQHVGEVIRPALEKGAVVVCDRFADSSVAYQVWGLGMDGALVDRLNALATGGLVPDLTFWLDLPVGERLGEGEPVRDRDRIESRGSAFFERVRRGYEALARANPDRYVRLEVAGKSREAVHSEVRAAVVERLAGCLEELGWGRR